MHILLAVSANVSYGMRLEQFGPPCWTELRFAADRGRERAMIQFQPIRSCLHTGKCWNFLIKFPLSSSACRCLNFKNLEGISVGKRVDERRSVVQQSIRCCTFQALAGMLRSSEINNSANTGP